jgi:cell division protein FtsB
MARRTPPSASRPGRRLLTFALLAGAAAFAVMGGEFSTIDLLRQGRERERLQRNIDSLGRIVDSLRKYERRLATDAGLQERIAREEFGMVRGNKELLYRFTEPDTAAAAATKTARR